VKSRQGFAASLLLPLLSLFWNLVGSNEGGEGRGGEALYRGQAPWRPVVGARPPGAHYWGTKHPDAICWGASVTSQN